MIHEVRDSKLVTPPPDSDDVRVDIYVKEWEKGRKRMHWKTGSDLRDILQVCHVWNMSTSCWFNTAHEQTWWSTLIRSFYVYREICEHWSQHWSCWTHQVSVCCSSIVYFYCTVTDKCTLFYFLTLGDLFVFVPQFLVPFVQIVPFLYFPCAVHTSVPNASSYAACSHSELL